MVLTRKKDGTCQLEQGRGRVCRCHLQEEKIWNLLASMRQSENVKMVPAS